MPLCFLFKPDGEGRTRRRHAGRLFFFHSIAQPLFAWVVIERKGGSPVPLFSNFCHCFIFFQIYDRESGHPLLLINPVSMTPSDFPNRRANGRAGKFFLESRRQTKPHTIWANTITDPSEFVLRLFWRPARQSLSANAANQVILQDPLGQSQ